MSHDDTTEPDSLSVRLEDRATGTLERFLIELRADRDPRIEDFLDDRGGWDRSTTLRALLAAELAWHRGRGESLDSWELRTRFPDDSELIEEILDESQPTVVTPYQRRVDADPDPEPRGDPASGRPRYEIARPHARGGLGVVSLALDQDLHREVALKEIRPEYAHDDEYRARFLREAEITGRLEHPGVVPIYGIGHHGDGRPYYIMRFIRGETLKQAIARLHGPAADRATGTGYTLAVLVGRFIAACHVLAYAHSQNVLHRDLKPANIMLGPYGETLVIDWGLAKPMDEPERAEAADPDAHRPNLDSQMTLTKVGSKLGTAGYMSPEQAAGNLAELRPTTDIYSLGVTLYSLICGKTPFQGCRQGEFLRRAREGLYPRPSEVAPSVPRALEAICLKAMALRPVDRYPSAEALAADLERWRAGEPVDADTEPAIDRIARWSKRHRTGLVAAAVFLVSTTIGLTIFAIQERQQNLRISLEMATTRAAEARARNDKEVADDARLAALAERSAAKKDLELTRLTLRNLLQGLSIPELAYLLNSGSPRLTLAEQVLGFYQDLIAKHPDDPDVKYELAQASQTTANIARSVGRFDMIEERYRRATDLLNGLLAESPSSETLRIELARTTIDHGEGLRMSGQLKEAEARQLQALEILGRRSGTTPAIEDGLRRAEALARLDLAGARLEMGKPLEARPDVDAAVKLLERLVAGPSASPIDRLYHLNSLISRAITLGEQGERDASKQDFDEATRLVVEIRQVPQNDNPDVRFIHAVILSRSGRHFAVGQNHADAWKAHDDAAKLLIALYKDGFRPPFIERELAVAWLGRAEAGLERLTTPPDPNQLPAIEGDLGRALDWLVGLANDWPDHYDYHALLGQNHSLLARLARINNQFDEVRASLTRSLEQVVLARQRNPDYPDFGVEEARLRKELDQLEADRAIKGASH